MTDEIDGVIELLRSCGCPVERDGTLLATPYCRAYVWGGVRVGNVYFVSLPEPPDTPPTQTTVFAAARELATATVKFDALTVSVVMCDGLNSTATASVSGSDYHIPHDLARAFARGQATAGQVLDALLDRGCLRAERMLSPAEDDENITDFPESP